MADEGRETDKRPYFGLSTRRIRTLLCMVTVPLTLAACGGGAGGSGANPESTLPPPPPPPTPPPESPPTPPPFGLTTSQAFATTGVTHGPHNNNGIGPVSDAPADAVEFRWSETLRAYEIRVPGTDLVTLRPPPQAASGVYEADDGRGNRLVVSIPVGPHSGIEFTYTSYASWHVQTSPASTREGGIFAFGIPTRSDDVPRSGTGTYMATVVGDSGGGTGYDIYGEARLVFDFAAGSLAGHMEPVAVDGCGFQHDLGRYEFTETVFGFGNTNFSGRFVAPGIDGPSFFEGRFTGPGAAELMARWRAPFVDPYGLGTGTMQGIWLGQRQ